MTAEMARKQPCDSELSAVDSSSDQAMQICSTGSLSSRIPGTLAVSEPPTLGKIPDFRPGSLGRAEPVRGRLQHRACSAGSRRQQQQDGFHACTRLLSKRKSYLHSLNTQGLGFPLGTCCCLPEGCFSLNSGKVHPQLFPETGARDAHDSALGRKRLPPHLDEEGQPSDGGGSWDLASGGQTSSLPRSLEIPEPASLLGLESRAFIGVCDQASPRRRRLFNCTSYACAFQPKFR